MYLRINVEDQKESRIHFYFPRVFGFLESAIFSEDKSIESKKAKQYRFYANHKENILKCKYINVNKGKDVIQSSVKNAMDGILKSDEDSFESASAEEIDARFNQLIKGKNNSNRVLVHCAMGISRSASIVIMYIMKKFMVSFESVLLNTFCLLYSL